MKLRLDPWPAEYEPAIETDGLATAAAAIDITVECPTWNAIAARAATLPDCDFVDGVRRVEARVLAEAGARWIHGLFGSLAVGTVTVRGGRANFGAVHLERLLILGAGEPQSLQVRGVPVSFTGAVCDENHPAAVLAELQSRMQQQEAALAEEAAGRGGCVFVDGLSYRATGHKEVVGVIKRILEPYVDEERFALVPRLQPGERTPLFGITDGVYPRYSAFLRLAMPRAIDHPLAGVVRIEIGSALGLPRARELADLAAAALPRFASTSARDARAPQNLLPVGALEHEMRRRLGDPVLIRRAIERELHEQRDR
jgi:uncharacterized protein